MASISQLDNTKIEKFSFRNKEDINKAILKINNKKFSITDISSKIRSIFADTDRLIDMKNTNHSSAREFYTEEKHLDNLLEALDIYDV